MTSRTAAVASRHGIDANLITEDAVTMSAPEQDAPTRLISHFSNRFGESSSHSMRRSRLMNTVEIAISNRQGGRNCGRRISLTCGIVTSTPKHLSNPSSPTNIALKPSFPYMYLKWFLTPSSFPNPHPPWRLFFHTHLFSRFADASACFISRAMDKVMML